MQNPEEKKRDMRLVKRYLQGNQDAFDEIVQLYWGKIYGHALHWIRNKEDAEEITQDTFIRARSAFKQFRGDASLSTWLYQIATHLSHNRFWYWKRRGRMQTCSLENSQDDNPTGKQTLKTALATEIENPEMVARRHDIEDKVIEAIQDLKPHQRDILTLRHLKGYSYSDISKILRVSIGTVKSRIARAKRALRRQIDLSVKLER